MNALSIYIKSPWLQKMRLLGCALCRINPYDCSPALHFAKSWNIHPGSRIHCSKFKPFANKKALARIALWEIADDPSRVP